VVENKFFAGFTYSSDGKNQLVRYCDWLIKQKQTKRLIVLTVKRRELEVKKVIDELLSQYQSEISIVCKYWDDLLVKWRSISTNSCYLIIINELIEYIDSHYVKSVLLTNKEIEIMSSKEEGIAFSKLLELVDKAYDYASNNYQIIEKVKWDEGRDYGFYFMRNKNEYWFGLWTNAWANNGCPINLQLRKINKKEVDKMDKDALVDFTKSGYYKIGDEYGLDYPFSSEIISTDDKVIEYLSKVTDIK